MNSPVRLATLIVLSMTAGFAHAQTGTLDQSSPMIPQPGANAGFNTSTPSLDWQQQVRAGLSGRLEGFVLQMSGSPGASIQVTVRMGPAWNTSSNAFQSIVAKTTTANLDNVFVDVTSANIQLVPGTLFVIDIVGQNNGAGLEGSYVAPPGVPWYSEPLFLGGTCYSDCGFRFGFQTYVLTSTSTAFCSGDGSGTACPCGNSGSSNNGCASSVSASGAHLAGLGASSISNDTFVLQGSSMPNSSALYFQGTAQTAGGLGSIFGDGLRCAGGSVTRLGTKVNTGGTSSYPTGADIHIGVKGANAAGNVRDYQVWYRNAAAYCTPSTFNLTNGVETTWVP
jgi:hypothetical protein